MWLVVSPNTTVAQSLVTRVTATGGQVLTFNEGTGELGVYVPSAFSASTAFYEFLAALGAF